MFARETMTVSKWYGRSVPVPDYGSRSFVPFLVGSMGIVKGVLQEKFGKPIHILFRNVDTAEADQGKGQIVINQAFVRGYFPMGGRLDSETTLGTILGIIVHEAAHFAYSPATLEPWAKYIKRRARCLYDDRVARALGNIVEDIFIESEVERRVPTLSWMLDCTNRVFFSVEQELQVQRAAEGITSAPTSLEDVSKLLNVLILAKTRSAVGINPWVNELFAMVRRAASPLSLEGRMKVTLAVYTKLMGKLEAAKSDEPEPGKGDRSETGEGAESGEPSDSSKKEPAEKSETGTGSGFLPDDSGEDEGEDEGETGDESEDEPDEAGESEGTGASSGDDALEETKRLAKGLTAVSSKRTPKPSDSRMTELERLLETKGDTEFDLESDSYKPGEALLVVEKVLESGRPLEADSRYDRLSEIARQRAVVNRPYGQDRNRGTHIRKLYRIATDQKIFAEAVPMNSYKPMQVIILLDCSGSMRSTDRMPDGRWTSLADAAAKATLGAAEGLVNARCEVAVYGHTAFVTHLGELTILQGKSFAEPITVLAPRLGWLLEEGQFCENKDGLAIEKVAKKFTAKGKRRLLIVISDGVPQAPDYYGASANRHTKNAVENARKEGIDVLSISIREDARTTNNYIYGEENNVFNTDPNVIEQVIRALLTK